MTKVYKSKSNNPYFNIALEQYLLFNQDADVSLYLWQNECSVIIGRNQNIYQECNVEFLKNNGVNPVRRFSGGGAVYHDMGNLNFTFLTTEGKHTEREFIGVIKNAMVNLGINCELSGRNDILVDEKKFSGQAYLVEDGYYLYHGTIMVDVDFKRLTQALTPSKLKLSSKGIKSVKSRVINLKQAKDTIDINSVSKSIEKEFKKMFGDASETIVFDESNINPPLFSKLESKEWIYSDSPEFEITIENKLSFGNTSVNVNVRCGNIEKIKIYTDSLYKIDFSKCEEILTSEVFDKDMIFKKIQNFYDEL